MKKFLLTLAIFVLFIIAIFSLPFTTMGNNYLANYIENELNKNQKHLNIKITNFSLGVSKVNLEATINETSNLKVNGDINLFKQSSNLNYKTYVSNLAIFNPFLDGLKLNGSLNTSGKIDIFLKKSLIIGDSDNILNGKLNFNFENNLLKANLKDANSQILLKTLNQKEFFTSLFDMDLVFDKNTNVGNIELLLKNGHFLKSNFSEILKNLAKIDITKELFSETKIISQIDNKVANSTIFMQSKNVQISSNSSFIDLNKEYIDTKLQFKLKDKSFNIDLKNSLKNPDIKLDINNILQNEINRFLNKFLK